MTNSLMMMRALLVSALSFALASGCRTSGARSHEFSRAEARQLLEDGRPEKAFKSLVDAWRNRPEDLSIARTLAEVSGQIGKQEELLRLLDRPNTSPQYVRAYIRGLVLFSRAAQSTEALAELRRATTLSPRLPELHHRLGRALLEVEDFSGAMSSLGRAISLEPKLTSAYLPLAQAQARSGDKGRAVETLRTWLRQGPQPEEVSQATALMDAIADPFADVPPAASEKIEQGLYWLEQRDVPQEALRYLEEVLVEYPDLSIVHALIGLCHQRLDDAGRALEAFRRAIELSPEQGKYHQYVGELYASRQRMGPAREALQKALQLHPLLKTAYARLGQLALQSKDLPTARTAFESWVALSPGAAAPKLELALVHQLMGTYPAAESLLLEVAHENPGSLEPKLRLGLLYVEMHRRATGEERVRTGRAAREQMQAVLREQPHNAVASRALQSLGTK